MRLVDGLVRVIGEIAQLLHIRRGGMIYHQVCVYVSVVRQVPARGS